MEKAKEGRRYQTKITNKAMPFLRKQFMIPSDEYSKHLLTEHPKELEVDKLFNIAAKLMINFGRRKMQAGFNTLLLPAFGVQQSTMLSIEEQQMWQNIEGLIKQAYRIHPEYTKKRLKAAINMFQKSGYLQGVAQFTRILSSLET